MYRLLAHLADPVGGTRSTEWSDPPSYGPEIGRTTENSWADDMSDRLDDEGAPRLIVR